MRVESQPTETGKTGETGETGENGHIYVWHSKHLGDYQPGLGVLLDFSVIFNGPVLLTVEHHAPLPEEMFELHNKFSFKNYGHWTETYKMQHMDLGFQVALASETLSWRKRAAVYQTCLQSVPSEVQRLSYNVSVWESIIARFNQLALLWMLQIEECRHHKFIKQHKHLLLTPLHDDTMAVFKRLQLLSCAVKSFRKNMKELIQLERARIQRYDRQDANDKHIANLPCELVYSLLINELNDVCAKETPVSAVHLKLQGCEPCTVASVASVGSVGFGV